MPPPGPGPVESRFHLDAILPPEASYAISDRLTPIPSLFAEEAGFVEGSVQGRREEFARGRAAAREALTALGFEPVPIPVGAQRQPIWPTDVVGSISHCTELAWATAAPSVRVATIGIDVEHDQSLPKEVRPRVLSPQEARVVEDLAGSDTVGFGAKECIHKAVQPLTGVWLDFHDVRLVPVEGEYRLRAEATHAGVPPRARRILDRLQIRWSLAGGLVFTCAWARPNGLGGR